jgi:hypothetical protein
MFVLSNRTVLKILGPAVAALALVLPNMAPAAEGPEILNVGDSVSKVTLPYLPRTITTASILNWNDANESTGVSVINLRHGFTPDTKVVVFDNGTNARDPQTLAKALDEVAKIVGNACLVVPTVEPRVKPDNSNTEKNRAIFEFATSRPRTLVPEWSGVVEMEPHLRIRSHDLYTFPEAAGYRGQQLGGAISDCVAIAHGHKEPRPQPVPLMKPGHLVEQALAASGEG